MKNQNPLPAMLIAAGTFFFGVMTLASSETQTSPEPAPAHGQEVGQPG